MPPRITCMTLSVKEDPLKPMFDSIDGLRLKTPLSEDDRRKAEACLAEYRDKLKTLGNSAPDVVDRWELRQARRRSLRSPRD